MTNKKAPDQNFLRTIALIITVVGAVSSLYFMFSVSRHQKSIVLITLFTTWVLSPFIGLFIINKLSTSWRAPARTVLHYLMIVLSIGSLIVYSGIITPPQTKPAAIFLLVPFLSWLLIGILTLITRKM